jgi:septal ring factor EnvC (AmiA/AmiB activator)
MVNEEVTSGETSLPRRATPLPWLLLGVTVIVAIGIFSMATRRLNDERLRTAASLKANDEVMGRLRTAASEFAKSELTVAELETKKAMLERQVGDLEEKNKSLSTELQELKDKTGKKGARK